MVVLSVCSWAKICLKLGAIQLEKKCKIILNILGTDVSDYPDYGAIDPFHENV